MKYQPKAKQSCLISLLSGLFVAFWATIFLYPILWHVWTNDICYRRYNLWRTSSIFIGDMTVAYYDLYHSHSYPLHNAVIRNRIDLVRKSPEEQIKSDRQDSFGMTPLAYAARNGLQSELEYLLTHGANPDIITWNQLTATMHALEKDHYKAAICLIENGADAGIVGMNGMTAIHMAAGLNQDQIIAMVAADESNRHKLDLTDSSGLTPLDYAIYRSATKAVIQLAASGAECKFTLVPQNDKIAIFLSQWQQSRTSPFTLPISAEVEHGYYAPSRNDTIPAELPQNVKPETFRNRGH